MSQLQKLKSAQSRKELARILGYKPSTLTAIIYKTPNNLKYSEFTITKKSGGERLIKAPNPKLKKLQSHLSNVLYQCLKEIESENVRRPIAFGFREGRSIIENAAMHKRRRWVLNLDLEDFFPSFNFGRVRGFFLKDKAFELHPEVATTIAQIACDGQALPQGSPCSPIISELIAQILDMRLIQLAKKFGANYTRYADDITFSTNQREFPVSLATHDSTDPSVWHLSGKLTKKIVTAGFRINNEKTRMHVRGSRQIVTGLIVNEKVNIPKEYYRRARAMCDSIFESGEYFLKINNVNDKNTPELTDNLLPIEGILNFIYSVTQTEDQRSSQEQRQDPRAIRKLFKRFLFYKYFLALNAPLIITEGKTDPVYLKAAIKSRSEKYTLLGSRDKKCFNHNIRYFDYSGHAHEILDLGGGGTGNLKSIPLDYRRNLYASKNETKRIKHRPMQFPVILVLDNDDGLAPVASMIKETFGVQFSWRDKKEFYHVTDNLYVVKTPEINNNKSYIEQLFPKKWLGKKLNGKSFNPSNQIDPKTDYSKEIFANSVVKPNAKIIDFSGFDPLLDRISRVIESYTPDS